MKIAESKKFCETETGKFEVNSLKGPKAYKSMTMTEVLCRQLGRINFQKMHKIVHVSLEVKCKIKLPRETV